MKRSRKTARPRASMGAPSRSNSMMSRASTRPAAMLRARRNRSGCLVSRTLTWPNPSSTPSLKRMRLAVTRSAIRSFFMSFARELRLPLFEEGGHAFAKIPAHVAHQDEVIAGAGREGVAQTQQRLLGRAERQRRVLGDAARQRRGPRGERGLVGQDFADEAPGARLLGTDKPRGEEQIPHPRRADERREPRDVG